MPDLGLSTRETAVGIWLAVLLLGTIVHREIRSSLLGVIRAAVKPAIILPFSLMAVYTAVVVWVLSNVGLWTVALAKDTVVWFIVAGAAFAFRAATADGDQPVLRAWLRDSIAIIVVFEFLLARYTLPLPAELISLPVFTTLALVGVVAERDPKHSQVAGFTGALQILLALPILAFTLASVIIDFANLATLGVLRELLLAPILSIAFIPFAYALRVFVGYDSLLRRLGWRHRLPISVWTYAAIRLIRHLGLCPRRVKSFIRRHGLRIPHVQSLRDVDEIIREDQQDEPLRPAA